MCASALIELFGIALRRAYERPNMAPGTFYLNLHASSINDNLGKLLN